MFIKGRLNRRQYDALLPVPRVKKTFRDAMALIRRTIKRAAIAAGHIEDPATKRPKWDYHWEYEDNQGPAGGIVQANTTGEARALIKKELGINKHHRLWQGTQILRVAPNANPPDIAFPDGRLANAG